MRLVLIAAMAIALTIGNAAKAQSPVQPAQTTSPTVPDSPNSAMSPQDACRESARRANLRGSDLRDHMEVCMLEARLDCTRKAIAQKIVGPERRTLIRTCLGRS